MKMRLLDRILLLLTGLFAAYQIAVGIDGFSALPVMAYTVAFGVLLVAGLILIILGFDVLDSPIVVTASTVIPLALSLGLVWQYWEALRLPYLGFVILGFSAILITRTLFQRGKLPVFVLAFVHGISGLLIFLLPIVLAVLGRTHPLFSLVGIGGALIGIGGLLLSFLKTGKPLLSRETILKILPALLLLMTICYVIGFLYS